LHQGSGSDASDVSSALNEPPIIALACNIGASRLQGAPLGLCRRDPDAVRDDLRDYVPFHLEEQESGGLIADKIGFLKKGEQSVGVVCQYTGTAS
jgi:hypothetical protein